MRFLRSYRCASATPSRCQPYWRILLRRGETLAGLAESYYGTVTASDVLLRFNTIDDPTRLSTGQTIRVPLLAFPAADPRRSDVAKPPPERKPVQHFATELAAAAAALAEGRYAQTRQLLESLDAPVRARGTVTESAELARLLAFTYVAFDLADQACRAYLADSRAGPA